MSCLLISLREVKLWKCFLARKVLFACVTEWFVWLFPCTIHHKGTFHTLDGLLSHACFDLHNFTLRTHVSLKYRCLNMERQISPTIRSASTWNINEKGEEALPARGRCIGPTTKELQLCHKSFISSHFEHRPQHRINNHHDGAILAPKPPNEASSPTAPFFICC